MKPLIKCACPKCGCVVFEPETFVLANQSMTCIPGCGHVAPTSEWVIAGAYSRRRPSFWIGLSDVMVRTRRMAEEFLLARQNAVLRLYRDGFRF
jgi:hypothetical protein